MWRVLTAEVVKLRRAKVFAWSLGVVAFFALMSYWTVRLGDPELQYVTWESVMRGTPTYLAGWWGILIFSMAAAHLFGAEFSDGTAATMLTTPIRRQTFMAGKMLVLAGWVAALAAVAVLTNAAVASTMAHDGFSCDVFAEVTGQTFQVAFMFYLTLPVIALVAMASRGYLAPMILAGGIMALNLACTFLDLAEWFPWAMPSTVAGGMGPPTSLVGELPLASWALLAAMFVLGLAGVFTYVNRAAEGV
jgi:ABC-2 type transport system permease protein